jgi:hypothetical protein
VSRGCRPPVFTGVLGAQVTGPVCTLFEFNRSRPAAWNRKGSRVEMRGKLEWKWNEPIAKKRWKSWRSLRESNPSFQIENLTS